MSFIRHRKINGIMYAYEVTSYRDENGKKKSHEKCLGRVAEDGQTIIMGKKRKSEENETKSTSAIVPYRTKAEAEADREKPLTQCPNKIATPTLPGYEHSLSFHQEGKAYIQHIMINTDGLKFENGEMFFEGALEPISTVELKNMSTKKGIEKIDITLLSFYYSVILTKYQERLKRGESLGDITSQLTTVYAPDLARAIGIIPTGEDGGLNRTDILRIMDKMKVFHSIVGIMHIKRNRKSYESYFPVLNFEGYDSEKNTISFYSPYLIYVVRKIFAEAKELDKKDNPKLNRKGFPRLTPHHSFLIKSTIVKERNKAAVDNVRIIVQVIEQTGNFGTPHIKASTIVERNEVLKLRLEKDTHPNRLLSRVFKKTWQLLREQTNLLDAYEDIELPDPEDIRFIPTLGNLDKLVFEFPHKGKKGRKSMQK